MSRLVFGFAVLMLVASLIPACGGSGDSGSAGAAPPVVQTPMPEFKVYEQSPIGPITIPGGGVATMARNIVFFPTINTEILRIDVEGSALFYGPQLPQLDLQLMYGGIIISRRVMNPGAASAYRGFRMSMFIDWATFGTAVPAPYPNDAYNIRVIFINPPAQAGSVTALKVRIVTVENPTVIVNSPLISG